MLSFPTLAERGEGVEQFRSLRTHVYQARYEAPLKTILISSGMPSEGKTFVAANLAMSLARNSVNNILLIDGDLRRPTLHSLLGAPNTPGLSEYLAETAELSDIMQRDRSPKTVESATARGISNLTFIPSGKCGDNSSELAANHRIEELVATLSPHFDWILIDTPPVLAVTDAVDLARAADAVLLVVREASTPFDVAQRTQAAFSNSRILGFVLNAVKNAPPSGSYYYYYGGEEAGGRAQRRKDKRSKG
jgi:capsular exopolysaccharide synthesis family protein